MAYIASSANFHIEITYNSANLLLIYWIVLVNILTKDLIVECKNYHSDTSTLSTPPRYMHTSICHILFSIHLPLHCVKHI